MSENAPQMSQMSERSHFGVCWSNFGKVWDVLGLQKHFACFFARVLTRSTSFRYFLSLSDTVQHFLSRFDAFQCLSSHVVAVLSFLSFLSLLSFLSFSHTKFSLFLSFSLVLSFYRSLVLSFSASVVLSFSLSLILSFSDFFTQAAGGATALKPARQHVYRS